MEEWCQEVAGLHVKAQENGVSGRTKDGSPNASDSTHIYHHQKINVFLNYESLGSYELQDMGEESPTHASKEGGYHKSKDLYRLRVHAHQIGDCLVLTDGERTPPKFGVDEVADRPGSNKCPQENPRHGR